MIEYEKRAMIEAEDKYTFRQSTQISMQTGLIGHLRADMDTDGNGFFSSWFDFREELKTDEFKAEFDEVINSLREEGDILHNRRSLAKYCYCTPQSRMQGEPGYYGVRVDTEKYAYLLRLNPDRGEYNLYCYCYRRDWLDQHLKDAEKGIRFIDSHYKELFRIPDGGKVKIHYSWNEDQIRTCRYIDDYHVEIGSNLYHICEFAERMEYGGHTCEPVRDNLPERCYSVLSGSNEIIIIKRGEKGYFKTDIPVTDKDEARSIANEYNTKLGVSRAQEEAMKAGKQVVTANKDLLAEYGDPLFEIATENKCDLQFEAAVAGAIPIIRPLRQSLAGSQLTEIMGIVNGTTNYILTKMSEEGMGYQEALDMATRLGYAEADPTADVEGYDAGRKIAIMASIAFSSRVTFPQVYTEGITKITAEDIRYAKEFGYVIKLLGITKLTGKGIEVKVHPTLIPDSHPLATVRDSFNAVFVHGQACDDAMFMGRGAGQMPTASAVLGDVIDVMRNIIHGSCGKIGSDSHKKLPVLDVEDTKSRFFLRLQVENRAGALANIAGVLGNNDVSIAQMVQKRSHDGFAEIVVITDLVKERHFNDAIRIMEGMSVVREISGIIRVY